MSKTMKRMHAAAILAGIVGILSTLPAAAQTIPSYAAGTTDETIRGTVAAINGQYTISVRDVHGYVDSVTLHPGTIINPRGIALAPGMPVTILGTNRGATLSANEIDTPYPTLGTVPVHPAYSLGLRFGFGHGW